MQKIFWFISYFLTEEQQHSVVSVFSTATAQCFSRMILWEIVICSSNPRNAMTFTSLRSVWGEAGSVRKLWCTARALPPDCSLLLREVDMDRFHWCCKIDRLQRAWRISPASCQRELIISILFISGAVHFLIFIPQSMALMEKEKESISNLYLCYGIYRRRLPQCSLGGWQMCCVGI